MSRCGKDNVSCLFFWCGIRMVSGRVRTGNDALNKWSYAEQILSALFCSMVFHSRIPSRSPGTAGWNPSHIASPGSSLKKFSPCILDCPPTSPLRHLVFRRPETNVTNLSIFKCHSIRAAGRDQTGTNLNRVLLVPAEPLRRPSIDEPPGYS